VADGPSLSYSKSRWNTYERCQRQYWFNYIGYWNGWKLGTNPRTRQIYYNKNLRSLDQISGIIVHEFIANRFRNLNDWRMSAEEIRLQLFKMWSVYVANTSSKNWRNQKQTLAIAEWAFNGAIESDEIGKQVVRSHLAVENFFAWYEQSLFAKDSFTILSIDDNLSGFFELDIDGDKVRVYTIADLIIKSGSMYTIFDWKTGEEIGYDPLQGVMYVMYAFDRYDVEPKDVNFRVVNVTRKEDTLYTYTLDDCSNALTKINNDVRLFKQIDKQPEESFECTKTLDTCTRCTFKDLCPQGVKIC